MQPVGEQLLQSGGAGRVPGAGENPGPAIPQAAARHTEGIAKVPCRSIRANVGAGPERIDLT